MKIMIECCLRLADDKAKKNKHRRPCTPEEVEEIVKDYVLGQRGYEEVVVDLSPPDGPSDPKQSKQAVPSPTPLSQKKDHNRRNKTQDVRTPPEGRFSITSLIFQN